MSGRFGEAGGAGYDGEVKTSAPVRIAASILAADFARLGEEVGAVAEAVDMLHIDVMDGRFAPNISLGIPVIRSLRAVTGLHFDCHLMIADPVPFFGPLREAGADGVTVHVEAVSDLAAAARRAGEEGLRFGAAINPDTPFAMLEPCLERCDLAVVMSVQPGFGGQEFISGVLGKVEAARRAIDAGGLGAGLQIDGGIDPHTIRMARSAGADVFVAGTAIFRAADPPAAAGKLRAAAESG